MRQGKAGVSGTGVSRASTARKTLRLAPETHVNVTVILFSGAEYYGAISKIESDSFEVAEVDRYIE